MNRKQEVKKIILFFIQILMCVFANIVSFLVLYFFYIKRFQDFNFIFILKQILLVVVIITSLLFESKVFSDLRLNQIEKFIIIIRDNFVGFLVLLCIHILYSDFLFSINFICYFILLNILFLYCFYFFIVFLKKIYSSKHKDNILLVGINKISQLIKKKGQRNHNSKYSFYPYDINDVLVFKNYLKENSIKQVIVAEKFLYDNLLEIADVCDELDIEIRFSPSILEMRMGEVVIDNNFGIPLLQIKPVSFLDKNFIYKRVFDVLFSIVVIIFCFLPSLFVTLIIKLTSKGDIIYKQKRVGLRGREFEFYKFRTMIKNADNLIDTIKHLNEREGEAFKIKNDPRMTWVGRFLRKFSIDEIPQFYNVLKGDMSIVGPRPPLPREVEKFSDLAKRRFKIFPGITGIWQISGRSNLSFDEMINLDIYYLENWSIYMDIEIIIKTIPAVLISKGAF